MNPLRLCHHALCPNEARGLYGKFCARHAFDEVVEITESCNGYEKELMPTSPKAEKDTAGKPAFDILFNTPIKDVAAVFTFGAEKYKEPMQWRKSLEGTPKEMVTYVESLMAAAIRHIEEQFRCGADYSIDHQSDLPSLAHAVADLMMALDILKKASLK